MFVTCTVAVAGADVAPAAFVDVTVIVVSACSVGASHVTEYVLASTVTGTLDLSPVMVKLVIGEPPSEAPADQVTFEAHGTTSVH
jgi:hypothetical protein